MPLMMRRPALVAGLMMFVVACHGGSSPGRYLYVWAGDSARKASDFLAVINADPNSSQYGAVVTSIATGSVGAMPHHTEAEMPADGHLLANGFMAGKTWLFDLTTPTHPVIVTSFRDRAGFSHPHTFLRLADGTILATFQYAADSTTVAAPMTDDSGGMAMPDDHTTGGLVEMDERGNVIRSASARDTTIADRKIYPYSVLAIPALDRAVSTTTDMNPVDSAPMRWVQFWRLSDLALLKTIPLPPGPRGNEEKFTGEPRLLPDGKSVYVHTFSCGLYLITQVDAAVPQAQLVYTFPGDNCGVPVLAGHYWLQTVPALHALVSLDISDPAHPRQVSSVAVGDDEKPHWAAIDPTGRRVVINSAGYGGDRLFVIDLDPSTGELALDTRFRDAGSAQAGVSMRGRHWPHGFTGTAMPHGTVFSR